MVIIRYNTEKQDWDEVVNISKTIKTQLKDEEVLVLPYDWDILFNCTTAELYAWKEQIEHLMHEKEICEEI